MMSSETVEITQEDYDRLLEDQQFLMALQVAGVDNWDGYSHAQDIVDEWNGEE